MNEGASPKTVHKRLLSVGLAHEHDVVCARQRARQIASFLGLDHQDQIRIATAVSEIVRNALQYAGGGKVEYNLTTEGAVPVFEIVVTDQGHGIRDLPLILSGNYKSPTGLGLGIVGAHRLMDSVVVESGPGLGTRVILHKRLPGLSQADMGRYGSEISSKLIPSTPIGPFEELRQQNQELVQALEELRRREIELQHLNRELEDTNRGVIALHTELEENATSLRRADRLKSQFLSHMSHEFRTPLNSILALSRILLSLADGPLTPEQNRQIGYVRQAAEDLVEMVNDLLDLAKVEAGKTQVFKAEFEVSRLFGALRGMLKPLKGRDAVTLIVEDPDRRQRLLTDEAKVGQILRNLVSNALKFTEAGEVRLTFRAGEHGAVFAVRDTGIGIPEEHQELIFDEFEQIDSSVQRSVKGTGLGLPLSRKLAELLGGTLTVESRVGMGSTFSLTLPPRVLVEDRKLLPGEERPGAATLLVIDDNERSRYLIKKMVGELYLNVTEADRGDLGIERARFDRPRAIVLDLTMPGLSGFEVLEQLKSFPETSDIPVIIYTSRTLSAAEREIIHEAGATIVLKRESDPKLFLNALRQVVGDPEVAGDV